MEVFVTSNWRSRPPTPLSFAWFEKHCRGWSLAHTADVLSTLERDIFPDLGDRPADEVVSRDLLEAVRRIENRGCATTAAANSDCVGRGAGQRGEFLRAAVHTC